MDFNTFEHRFIIFVRASMSFAGIGIGEDDKDTGLQTVGDPALAAIDHPITTVLHLVHTWMRAPWLPVLGEEAARNKGNEWNKLKL